MQGTNILLFGTKGQAECLCNNMDSVVNCLRNFDADFGFTKCVVVNAEKDVVSFTHNYFGSSDRYKVEETKDGVLVSFVA